ncbi:Lrp/AsnC family transcriptional regulator [Allonocardiopsis opalescens]|uniref:AsnC family transcriptional regulator n=1 Tax=Allonocardiopsis opalescens TaxID=1144618 RepID=A0A2T0Q4F5_9ACTN|nr:Lrp/AsnC family transcriptional regulator [Allonocardiopsis opalescens]PRX98697.1 AsnC family transcriptional regulator [Allonocardiopsis opalescens]
MLDAVDAALVRQLQGDGRATYQALADQVGLSRTAVRARVRQLLEAGTVRVVGVVHAAVAGLAVRARVAIDVTGPTGRVLAAVERRPSVAFLALTSGGPAAVAELRVADDTALARELAELRAVPGVAGVEVFRALEVVKDVHSAVRPLRPVTLDALDWKLLEQLQQDGRVSYAQLARIVGLSQAAARSRVVRLIDAGVVHVTALVDPVALGVTRNLGVALRTRGPAAPVAGRLADLPGVSVVMTGFGGFDVVSSASAADRPALVRLLESVRALPSVAHVRVWEHIQVVKGG